MPAIRLKNYFKTVCVFLFLETIPLQAQELTSVVERLWAEGRLLGTVSSEVNDSIQQSVLNASFLLLEFSP
jgi:hypothetical protein